MAKKFMYACLGILMLAAAFHLGAVRGQASSYASDIAVATGNITHGQQIPLPHYTDGTQATQEECVWLLSASVLHTGHNSTLGFFLRTDLERVVEFEQRTIHGHYFDSIAGYLIIGVRGSDPTSAQPSTWSQIKAEFGE